MNKRTETKHTNASAQHSDDIAVDRFATAMKTKMVESRSKGRYGWDDENVCESEYLRMLLQQAVNKGDPVDVGNFAMMLFCRGESTAPVVQDDVVRDAERYRWLKGKAHKDTSYDRFGPDGCHWSIGFYGKSAQSLDAAIDSAMKGTK
jgi:hypothetical protein